jgi:tetratricopeptide (TPR) repeat protein
MKKLVLASVMALASLSLVFAPVLRAQDSITIKDPAEFNSYQTASQQSDPTAKAAALESFLETYPQSVVKAAVLDQLVDTYQGLGDTDKTLSAASRLLQADPNNLKAIFISVFIKKGQCAKTQDAQACDDAAALAQRGLVAPKSADTSDAEWRKLTGATYPVFHSAIALDDAVSKKDFKGAIAEYTAELMLYTDDQSKAAGLQDTLLLAQAYTQPGAKDLVKAIWFYARGWNFVPASFQPTVEKSIEYYYAKYHGDLKGLDEIKSQAALTTFPPATLAITPAPTPAEIAHKVIAETPNLMTLALEDKEFILANGSPDDAAKMWAVLKDQVTQVPGIVIEATSSVIKLAVARDARGATPPYADFIVNLKKPLEEKEIPSDGFEFNLQPKAELDGTYDTFSQIPATATTEQRAEIVLRAGVIVPAEKRAAPHKPTAGHRR